MLDVPRPRLSRFNPCILRECAKTLFHHGVVYVKTYHFQRTPSKNQVGSIEFDVDYSWRRSQLPCVFLCQFSCDTCFNGFVFYLDHVDTPCVGYFGHGRVRWCSLPRRPRLYIFLVSATKRVLWRSIGNVLVASRRLVMHTCESHDEGMICFIMAFGQSCACSPVPHTTLPIKIANCRAPSDVRICWCIVPHKMRSTMFRPCSRRKHPLPPLNPASSRIERTLNKDAVQRDGKEVRRPQGRQHVSISRSDIEAYLLCWLAVIALQLHAVLTS